MTGLLAFLAADVGRALSQRVDSHNNLIRTVRMLLNPLEAPGLGSPVGSREILGSY